MTATRLEIELSTFVVRHRGELENDLAEARAAYASAEADLSPLTARVRLLEGLLSLPPNSTAHPSGLVFTEAQRPHTLHEAMHRVLMTQPNKMMRAADLAREVDRRGLYKMRDGRAVEATQIHARVGNYADMFRKSGTFIEAI